MRSGTVHFRQPSLRKGERRWCEGWPVADASGRWPQRSRMRHVGGSRFSEARLALLVAALPKGLRQVGDYCTSKHQCTKVPLSSPARSETISIQSPAELSPRNTLNGSEGRTLPAMAGGGSAH